MTKEQLLEKHVALLEEKILLQEQKIVDLQKALDKELQNDAECVEAPKVTTVPHPGYGGIINTPNVSPYQPSFGGSIQGQRCAQGCNYSYAYYGIGPVPCLKCGLPNPFLPSVTIISQTSSDTQQQANQNFCTYVDKLQNVTLTGGLSVKS